MTRSAAPDSVAVSGAYQLPEVAGRASLHLFAVQRYSERRQRDLDELPPPNQPLTAARVATLNSLASNGNARAACVLAQEVAKCGFFPLMGEKELRHRERLFQQRQSEGRRDPELERLIAGSRAALIEIGSVCADYSPGPDTKPAWQFMLQSALMGYEPAMRQFVNFPMFDPTDWAGSIDAFAAYREYYGPMLDALAQQGNDFELTVASVEYAGRAGQMNVFDVQVMMPRLPTDPVRALAFTYADAALQDRQSSLLRSRRSDSERSRASRVRERLIERQSILTAKLSPEQQYTARLMADQMMAGWTADVFDPPAKPDRPSPSGKFDDFDSVCRE